MAATKLADIIVPDIALPYMEQKVAELSAFVQSGITVSNPAIEARANDGGHFVDMPFWNDLNGEAEVSSDTTPLTVNNITSDQDIAVKLLRGKAFGANALATEIAGSDPLRGIMDKFARFWVREEQRTLLSTLKGGFAGPLSDTHVLDITGNTDKTISTDAIIDAKSLLGDVGDELRAIAMHSRQYAVFQKLNLIQYERLSDQDIRIPYLMGYRVIVDDKMPTETDATGNTIYHTYLFSPGSVARAVVRRKNPVATDYDLLLDEEVVATRRGWVLHVPGVKWQSSTANPDNPTLATGTNWARVYDPKHIKVVCLKTL